MKRIISLLPGSLLIIAMLWLPALASAQNITVKGKVVDAVSGNPIDGVTVQLKNSKTGTSTNATGDFIITSSKGDQLVISYMGFENQVITANADFFIIRLAIENKQSKDVLITPMGVR